MANVFPSMIVSTSTSLAAVGERMNGFSGGGEDADGTEDDAEDVRETLLKF